MIIVPICLKCEYCQSGMKCKFYQQGIPHKILAGDKKAEIVCKEFSKKKQTSEQSGACFVATSQQRESNKEYLERLETGVLFIARDTALNCPAATLKTWGGRND